MSSNFHPPYWAFHTNIYEVNVRQYTSEGTFNAFARHLSRLRNMGVGVLWFMPVHPIGQEKRIGTLGSYYSISDHKAINPEFGSLQDFKQLVTTAHSLGFKIMMDWVANHTAWDHIWTKEHPDFYVKDGNGNFISPFDWHDVIQLDHNSEAQQEAMLAAMQFWISECDIDGFRCDMAHLIPLSFWKKARTRFDQLKPLLWLAETEEPTYHEVFDATYTWKFLHKMESYCRKETDIRGLQEVLQEYETGFPKNAIRLFFTSNHDENSHSGSEYERMGEASIPFAVLCATWGGIPLVYSGQEIPFTKRLNFFNKDEIRWTGNNMLHDFYKTLLHLHSSHSALEAGDEASMPFRINTNKNDSVFAFCRKSNEREILVILNLSPDDQQVEIIDERVKGNFKNVFSESSIDLSFKWPIEMQRWGYLVFVK